MVVVIILVLAIIGSLYYYTQVYPQPNIQVTNVVIPTPVQNPQSTVVVDEGRVSGSGSFNYSASLVGTYDMIFDNSFSIVSTKQVSVSYNAGGVPGSASLSVPPGTENTVSVALNPNEHLMGTFEVSGGSGNDVNFEIIANTCTQQVTFSFTLANAGNSGGFANVSMGTPAQSFWTDRYYVPAGQNVPVSGQTTIQDCLSRSFSVGIISVTKS